MVYFLTFSDVPANWLVSTSGYLIYYNWELRFINGIETTYHGKNHFGRKVFIRSKTVYKIVSLKYQHPNLNELKIVFMIERWTSWLSRACRKSPSKLERAWWSRALSPFQGYVRLICVSEKYQLVHLFLKGKTELLASNTIEITGLRLQKNTSKTGTRGSQLQSTPFFSLRRLRRSRAR